MELALMIEGQDGTTWPRWQRLARLAEELGFVGLYRSDHFTNANPPEKQSLECWTSLTWLASHTSRLEFGPLVSPVSFRRPAMLARMAASVDDLSGGRLQLGVGAGWQEREHTHFGYDLLDVKPRFDRFREALEVIIRLLRSDEPVSFEGQYFRLQDAVLLPRPNRPGGPPIVIGGNGKLRTLPLAARYADEWNATFKTPAAFADLNAHLDRLLDQVGRDRRSVRRTLMTPAWFGQDDARLQARLAGRSADDMRARGAILGTRTEVREQVQALAEAGVQRLMLQWLDQEDLQGIEALYRALN
jgi:F420-dependent oxidoreductase-like protein